MLEHALLDAVVAVALFGFSFPAKIVIERGIGPANTLLWSTFIRIAAGLIAFFGFIWFLTWVLVTLKIISLPLF